MQFSLSYGQVPILFNDHSKKPHWKGKGKRKLSATLKKSWPSRFQFDETARKSWKSKIITIASQRLKASFNLSSYQSRFPILILLLLVNVNRNLVQTISPESTTLQQKKTAQKTRNIFIIPQVKLSLIWSGEYFTDAPRTALWADHKVSANLLL